MPRRKTRAAKRLLTWPAASSNRWSSSYWSHGDNSLETIARKGLQLFFIIPFCLECDREKERHPFPSAAFRAKGGVSGPKSPELPEGRPWRVPRREHSATPDRPGPG